MSYRFNIDFSGLNYNNNPEFGLEPEDFRDFQPHLTKAFQQIEQQHRNGSLGFLDLPFNNQKIVEEIYQIIDQLPSEIENLLLLGIGGSALGNQMLFSSLCHPFHNEDSKYRSRPQALKLYILDNIDPVQYKILLEKLDPSKTLINVITKSGTTAETMSAFLIFYQAMVDAIGETEAGKRIVAITDPSTGELRKLANKLNLANLSIPPNVGGRFSVLTAVGLFSAAASGIDIKKLLAGASEYVTQVRNNPPESSPAAKMAAYSYWLHTEKGLSQYVLMPYCNQLYTLADWFRQLWAESLGKKFDRDGQVVYEGQTPIKALGATDQHSQSQLYSEGPFDKQIQIIRVKNFQDDVKIPPAFPEIEAISYLHGHTIQELIDAELLGTKAALIEAARPVSVIELEKIDPETMGQLIIHFELQTAIIGELYNINAYDQPGVEQAKKIAYGLMGRPGFEEYRQKYGNHHRGD